MEKKQEIAASVAAMFGEATNPDPTSLPEQPTGRTLHFEKVHRAEPAEPLPEPQEQPAPAEAQPEPQPSAEPLISMRGIRKSFYIGQPNELEILHGIDLDVYPGEFVAVVGESGSGKSTLMNIIGVLDRPTKGSYLLDGVNVHEAADDELARIRNQKIGFVFQTYNLIARQSALKNVEIPMLYAGIKPAERTRRAKEWLERVGMGDRYKHQPNELSGGQKQRVAIARAMVNEPALILADEPTGALDSHTGREVLGLLQQLHKQGHTVVLITHDNSIAVQAERIIRLEDGRVVYDGDAHAPEAVVQPNFMMAEPKAGEEGTQA